MALILPESITNEEGFPSMWSKTDFDGKLTYYNEHQIEWVGAFFEAHPWITRMMIVFDD